MCRLVCVSTCPSDFFFGRNSDGQEDIRHPWSWVRSVTFVRFTSLQASSEFCISETVGVDFLLRRNGAKFSWKEFREGKKKAKTADGSGAAGNQVGMLTWINSSFEIYPPNFNPGCVYWFGIDLNTGKVDSSSYWCSHIAESLKFGRFVRQMN